MSSRQDILRAVAGRIGRLPRDHVRRVAVDGVDGAGKTTFADELACVLETDGTTVVRASVDAFHNPKTIRYRLGRTSHEGFFRDSYDYPGLKIALLDPLSPGGSGRYRARIFDPITDSPVLAPEALAAPGSILIFDGIYLLRPELRSYWDFSIFLQVAFDVSIPRGAQRGPGFGSPDPQAPENRRYVEGQMLYLRECQPTQYATVTIDNNDLATPHVI